MEHFQNVQYLEFLWRMNTCAWEEANEMVAIIQRGLDNFGPRMAQSRWITFHYNLATYFFIQEDFEQSRQWLYPLSKLHKPKSRQDILGFKPFLELILDFELQSDSLFESVQALARKSTSQAPHTEFQILLLKQLKELANLPREECNTVFLKIRDLFDPKNQRFDGLGVFETYLWAKAKTQHEKLYQSFEHFVAEAAKMKEA